MFGFLILIIGLFFFLKNLGLITSHLWDILWPLLLIAIGFKIMLGRKHTHWGERCCHFGEEMHKKFHDKNEKGE